MYETIRIVGQVRPKYVLWENVKNILSKKHKHNFDAYIETMNVLGYNSYYKVLNAKDYGIPQNRERVYTVSIRKDIMIYDDYNSSIRKDQDTIGTLTTNCGSSALRNGWKIIEYSKPFVFPEKEELKLRLKDMLEKQVDEKYYLSDAQIERIKTTTYNVGKTRIQEKDYCDTLCARDWKDPKCVQVGNLQGGNTEPKVSTMANDSMGVVQGIKVIGNYMPSNHDASRIVDSNGLAPTVKENHGTVTAIVEKINKNAKHQQDLVQSQNDVCRVIPAGTHGSTPHLLKTIVNENPLRIRKLTPKECWRLMGFDDEDFEKAERIPTSNTQLYKQAGNSIVVNVLEKIFKNLFQEEIWKTK